MADPQLIPSFITLLSGVTIAGATYWFTKQKERDAELRKEKLQHYKEFVASLNGIFKGEGTDEGQKAFSKASNNLMLVAPQKVIVALKNYQKAIQSSNPDQGLNEFELISKLFYELRRDLNIKPFDDPKTFEVRLWSSGVIPSQDQN